VQQQDAAAARFKPLERAANHLAGADARPVVSHKVHAPGHVAPGGEIALDRRLPQQARNAEKSADAIRLAKRGTDRGEAVLDLARGVIDRHPGERERMVLAVVADGVAFGIDALDELRIGAGHAADHEEGRLHALIRERIKNVRREGRQRSVVKGDDHLMIIERESLPVLE
jgi:hypothetical protein